MIDEPGGFDPPAFDPPQLVAALDAVTGWREHIDSRVTTDRYRVCPVVSGGKPTPRARLFRTVLAAFAPVQRAWLAETSPGGKVAAHIDPPPHRERWHVPILAAGVFHQDGETFTPQAGAPFQVKHWTSHWTANDTDCRRVHLIIDRKE